MKISEPCTALDPKWSEVKAEPALPVQHGTEMTLTCPADHIQAGSRKATCNNGAVIPAEKSPHCYSISELSESISAARNNRASHLVRCNRPTRQVSFYSKLFN